VSRASYRFRNYTVRPDLSPDAEPVRHTAQCAVCQECGPEAGSSDAAVAWVVIHLKGHPEHLSYREIITRPYRAVPGGWQ
jgi:hypothetical protein